MITEFEQVGDGYGRVRVWKTSDGSPIELYSPDAREWIEAGQATLTNPKGAPEPEPEVQPVTVGAAGQTVTTMEGVGPVGGAPAPSGDGDADLTGDDPS